MTLTTRQYIKLLDEETVKKLLKISHLTDLEYWVLYYSYKKRMVDNTCMKLNIGKTTYHNTLNIALAKVACTIKSLNQIQIIS